MNSRGHCNQLVILLNINFLYFFVYFFIYYEDVNEFRLANKSGLSTSYSWRELQWEIVGLESTSSTHAVDEACNFCQA